MSEKPPLPMVLGSGPLADAMRAQIAADPDRYRAMTSSIHPIGHCPCCGKDVFRVKSRATNFEEGFATGLDDDAIIHPRLNADGFPDPKGEYAGGCKEIGTEAEWVEKPSARKLARMKRRRR